MCALLYDFNNNNSNNWCLNESFWMILQYLTTLIPYDPKTVPPNIEYLQIYVKSNTPLLLFICLLVTQAIYCHVMPCIAQLLLSWVVCPLTVCHVRLFIETSKHSLKFFTVW